MLYFDRESLSNEISSEIVRPWVLQFMMIFSGFIVLLPIISQMRLVQDKNHINDLSKP